MYSFIMQYQISTPQIPHSKSNSSTSTGTSITQNLIHPISLRQVPKQEMHKDAIVPPQTATKSPSLVLSAVLPNYKTQSQPLLLVRPFHPRHVTCLHHLPPSFEMFDPSQRVPKQCFRPHCLLPLDSNGQIHCQRSRSSHT